MLTSTAIQVAIRQAKASGKQIKKFDERGLYLLCKPNGAALWRFKYAFDGVEKGISFGNVSDVPLKRAREKRDEARKLVADGVDPSAVRKAAKAAQADSMERISREWLERQERAVSAGTLWRDRQRLQKFIWPRMGNRPIKSITPPELLDALR